MLAKITGLFRLTKDCEMRYANSGSAILKLSLACSEKYKDNETQLFLDAVAFGKPAEIIQQYAGAKGTQLFLSGKLETQSWEKDGQKHYKNSMTVESFEFIGNKQDAQQKPQEPRQTAAQQYPQTIPEIVYDDGMEDEIPF